MKHLNRHILSIGRRLAHLNIIPIYAVLEYRGYVWVSFNKGSMEYNHAEVRCIQKFIRRYGEKCRHLLRYTNLYCSLEPCTICKSILERYQILYLYNLSKDGKNAYNLVNTYEYALILRTFFMYIRYNNKNNEGNGNICKC